MVTGGLSSGSVTAGRAGGDEAAARAGFEAMLAARPGDETARLGLAGVLLRQGEAAAALGHATKAVDANPASADGEYMAGLAHKALGRYDEAIGSLGRAAQKKQGNFEAILEMGVVLRLATLPEQALTCFAAAHRLRPESPELFYYGGHALYDLGKVDEALASYRAAIRLRPDYLEAHQILNNLLWEHQRADEFLASYREALERMPQTVALYARYSQYLSHVDRTEEAEAVLTQGRARCGTQPVLTHALARLRTEDGDWEEALALFGEALAGLPGDSSLMMDYCRALIVHEDYDKALGLAGEVRDMIPDDQQNLAYFWLCKRLLGDGETARRLYDYDTLIRPFEVDCPPGYRDIGEFNRALGARLLDLHRTINQPLDQSVRRGTQTHGLLFDSEDPLIKAIKAEISKAVTAYIADMPDDAGHPLFRRKSGDFLYSGSWSVLLGPGGHHTNHVHDIGWISSAYYVDVPDDLDDGAHEGWIKFGESDLGLGGREEIGRLIRPRAGTLVLFPSYMYHGTVPIKTMQPRMTIAFDVVPGDVVPA